MGAAVFWTLLGLANAATVAATEAVAHSAADSAGAPAATLPTAVSSA